MKRNQSLEAIALNIAAATENNPELYIALLEATVQNREPIKLRGDRHGMMISFGLMRDPDYHLGHLVTFVDITPEDNWFNTASSSVASPEELELIQIPDSLKAKAKVFLFLFHPKTHTVVLLSKLGYNTISARMVQNYFQAALNRPSLVSSFGHISVSLIQSHDSIAEILALPLLSRLEIDIAFRYDDLSRMLRLRCKNSMPPG